MPNKPAKKKKTEYESPAPVTRISEKQKLTEIGKANMALYLAQILQKHLELFMIVELWPTLPSYIKATIITLAQIHDTEKGTRQ
jgi:hypothetical protein